MMSYKLTIELSCRVLAPFLAHLLANKSSQPSSPELLCTYFSMHSLLRNGSYGRQTDMIIQVKDTRGGSPEMITL
jgi:hypothetical protein